LAVPEIAVIAAPKPEGQNSLKPTFAVDKRPAVDGRQHEYEVAPGT